MFENFSCRATSLNSIQILIKSGLIKVAMRWAVIEMTI